LLSSLSILILALFSLIVIVQSASAYTSYNVSESTLSPIYVVSTRPYVPEEKYPPPWNSFNAPLQAISSILKFGTGCPPETAIYVHGYNRDDSEAIEEFNIIQLSLSHNNYRLPLIGLSWNSNTINYTEAEKNAQANGPRLAQFIVEYHKECPNSDIRLMSHSLGAAVVNSTLVHLDTNSSLKASISTDNNNYSKVIKSVHLLGATIDNKTIIKNSDFGNAIENLVGRFYNLYSPEDNGLEFNKAFLEGLDRLKHFPLGSFGVSPGMAPINYNDTNVAYEIPPLSDADGDGNPEECFEDTMAVRLWGDNHCGYIGFRQPFSNSLIDDGAMNMVVNDWIKS
jgi:Alpha/beta hydrolase of unknown function (DUF900)